MGEEDDGGGGGGAYRELSGRWMNFTQGEPIFLSNSTFNNSPIEN
jgi:hypothetical protein